MLTLATILIEFQTLSSSSDEEILCPKLTRLKLVQCGSEASGEVRRLVESRNASPINSSSSSPHSPTPPTKTTTPTPSDSISKLESLVVEPREGHIVCTSDDISWINERVTYFYVSQQIKGTLWRHPNHMQDFGEFEETGYMLHGRDLDSDHEGSEYSDDLVVPVEVFPVF